MYSTKFSVVPAVKKTIDVFIQQRAQSLSLKSASSANVQTKTDSFCAVLIQFLSDYENFQHQRLMNEIYLSLDDLRIPFCCKLRCFFSLMMRKIRPIVVVVV